MNVSPYAYQKAARPGPFLFPPMPLDVMCPNVAVWAFSLEIRDVPS